MNRLREYRERYGWSQEELVAEIHRRAVQRGDPVAPGLDQPALSRHENGHKRPGPRNRDLYCLVYGATPAELGFVVALPDEKRDPEDVDRREFLVGAAGLVASAAVPGAPTKRLDRFDLERLRQNLTYLRRLDDQHGSAAVYAMTTRTFRRLRGLVEHARYDHATGLELRALIGSAASRVGGLSSTQDGTTTRAVGIWKPCSGRNSRTQIRSASERWRRCLGRRPTSAGRERHSILRQSRSAPRRRRRRACDQCSRLARP